MTKNTSALSPICKLSPILPIHNNFLATAWIVNPFVSCYRHCPLTKFRENFEKIENFPPNFGKSHQNVEIIVGADSCKFASNSASCINDFENHFEQFVSEQITVKRYSSRLLHFTKFHIQNSSVITVFKSFSVAGHRPVRCGNIKRARRSFLGIQNGPRRGVPQPEICIFKSNFMTADSWNSLHRITSRGFVIENMKSATLTTLQLWIVHHWQKFFQTELYFWKDCLENVSLTSKSKF